MQAESKFKQRVLKDLRYFGEHIYVRKTQERSRVGVLDLSICLFGEYIAIELKMPGGKISKLQDTNVGRIRRSGGQAYVVDASGWDFLLGTLKAAYAKKLDHAA